MSDDRSQSVELYERERADIAAQIDAIPAQIDAMGVEGNAGDVNRMDTQNTTDGGPGPSTDDQIAPREQMPSQAEGERGATDVEDEADRGDDDES